MRSIAVFLVLVLIVGIGCVQQNAVVGNDSDSHGCKGSAGYSWCEAKQKCLRVWEENCTVSTKLRVITEEFPPYNFKTASGISGISTDIVRELMKRTNTSADIESMNWSDGYTLAISGPDTMIYSVARTSEREDKLKWVGPIGVWRLTFYADSKSNISITDMDGARRAGVVCVVKNDARYTTLMQDNFTQIQTVATDGECARKLKEGSVSLWFGSSTSFDGVIAKENLSQSDFKPVYEVMNNPLYIGFSKDVPDSVVSNWQEKLGDMYADGTYANITARYVG
jgi:polar amino acid transport system substrate-binding protein